MIWKEERVGGEKNSVWRLSGNVQGREGGQHSRWLHHVVVPTRMWNTHESGQWERLGMVHSVPNKQLPLFTHVPKPTFDVIREDALNSNQYING